jgi:hypothetical protein
MAKTSFVKRHTSATNRRDIPAVNWPIWPHREHMSFTYIKEVSISTILARVNFLVGLQCLMKWTAVSACNLPQRTKYGFGVCPRGGNLFIASGGARYSSRQSQSFGRAGTACFSRTWLHPVKSRFGKKIHAQREKTRRRTRHLRAPLTRAHDGHRRNLASPLHS